MKETNQKIFDVDDFLKWIETRNRKEMDTDAAAQVLFKFYSSLTEAGFSENQALLMLIGLLKGVK